MIRTGSIHDPLVAPKRPRLSIPERVLGPGCLDCEAPVGAPCDEACPSAVAADHDQVLAELDAHEDHLRQDYLERRSA